MSRLQFLLLACLVGLILLPSPASAFGAGNIASISSIEGKNWRHGDIEDMLKTVAFLRGTRELVGVSIRKVVLTTNGS